ncbi:hypothetical protein RhiirA4_479841 [Rhizophagus irregularis]|uniref:Uncharacterized protein n=1 Tax=Rhizophagus irregularis TaxID=588596 RepID=A0A2I1HH10_9GLOM|nr:hypothetical protein RhiirA4_479841 [Rhizophagus irregularis]
MFKVVQKRWLILEKFCEDCEEWVNENDMAKSNKDSFLRRCRKDIRSQRRAIWKREVIEFKT